MPGRFKLLALILFLAADPGSVNSQNPVADGYKGIWFSTGNPTEYGYKLSGGVATFGSRYRPIAIYSKEAAKTFFVYGGTKSEQERHLLIMISYYDHISNVVPKPVIVHDKEGVREPYDNASLSIDGMGFLWVFVSGNSRTRPGLIFRSSMPYSIERFDKIKEMEMLSPQPWWNPGSGFLLLFSKVSKGLEICFSSGINGQDWTDSRTLASMGGHLQVSGICNGKIYTAFNYFPGGNIDRQTNLYLLHTDDQGKTWKAIDEQVMETPLDDPDNNAIIRNFEEEGLLVHLSDIDFDAEGNPVLLVILSRDEEPGPKGGPREWMVISRKDNIWNFSKVCESTNNFDRGALYVTPAEWRIIGPTEPGPSKYGTGGEVAMWVSTNQGESWEKTVQITSQSRFNHSFVRKPMNPSKEFYALWADGNADEFSRSSLYFTNESGKRVRILPYEMKRSFQKPARVR
ncbi:MAG: hypothetical protein WAW07_11270 [Bacteroidales bacterium]